MNKFTPTRSAAALLIASFCLLGASTVARADSIDGDWCTADGKHMNIKGSAVRTPGGREITGNYSRHFFSYVVPAGEAGAGDTLNITLRGEHLAQSRIGTAEPAQDWRRCQPGVS